MTQATGPDDTPVEQTIQESWLPTPDLLERFLRRESESQSWNITTRPFPNNWNWPEKEDLFVLLGNVRVKESWLFTLNSLQRFLKRESESRVIKSMTHAFLRRHTSQESLILTLYSLWSNLKKELESRVIRSMTRAFPIVLLLRGCEKVSWCNYRLWLEIDFC